MTGFAKFCTLKYIYHVLFASKRQIFEPLLSIVYSKKKFFFSLPQRDWIFYLRLRLRSTACLSATVKYNVAFAATVFFLKESIMNLYVLTFAPRKYNNMLSQTWLIFLTNKGISQKKWIKQAGKWLVFLHLLSIPQQMTMRLQRKQQKSGAWRKDVQALLISK